MMSPCRSNLLPILITILSCCGLFIFFNLRLNEIKISVEKQNRVLTSFITNVKQDIKSCSGGAGGGSFMDPLLSFAENKVSAPEHTKNFAAPEALIAARRQEMDKIVVSDDDDDDSEDDCDSDSESDSEDENEQKSVNDVLQIVNLQQMRPISLEPVSLEPVSLDPISFESVSLQPISFESISFEVLSCVNLGGEKSVASESSITEIIEEPVLVNVANKAEEANVGKNEVNSYEQMKVDDLRKIVTDKNLSTKEEVKKLKKPELLLLLKK